MYISKIGLSLLLLCSPYIYGVHAHTIRYNSSCLDTEQRGNPDVLDTVIFKYKPVIPYNHIAATPTSLVVAKKDTFMVWHTWVMQAIENRLQELTQEATVDSLTPGIHAAMSRLTIELDHLSNSSYAEVGANFIAVPEQDVVLLMQWAKNMLIGGDDVVPLVNIILDADTVLLLTSCCGDLPFVVKDHIYWQRITEAGWIAVDADPMGRVQPVLHTNTIGEKFHFYKTRFGVYFRETLAADEAVPGDLLRIVKYLGADPRYDIEIHGNNPVLWIKFPSDLGYDASSTGRYIPGENAATASWLYAHDVRALYNELQQ